MKYVIITELFQRVQTCGNWRRDVEEGNVFDREIAFTLSHYRHGPNETNNMLATPDDISNLNLNNLAGSALGLWDHARVFLLSFLVFPLSRPPSFFSVSPLFLISLISLPYVPRYLPPTHASMGKSWLIRSLVLAASTTACESPGWGGTWTMTVC